MADSTIRIGVEVDTGNVSKLGGAVREVTTDVRNISGAFVGLDGSARQAAEATIKNVAAFASESPVVVAAAQNLLNLKAQQADLASQQQQTLNMIVEEGGAKNVDISLTKRWIDEYASGIVTKSLATSAEKEFRSALEQSFAAKLQDAAASQTLASAQMQQASSSATAAAATAEQAAASEAATLAEDQQKLAAKAVEAATAASTASGKAEAAISEASTTAEEERADATTAAASASSQAAESYRANADASSTVASAQEGLSSATRDATASVTAGAAASKVYSNRAEEVAAAENARIAQIRAMAAELMSEGMSTEAATKYLTNFFGATQEVSAAMAKYAVANDVAAVSEDAVAAGAERASTGMSSLGKSAAIASSRVLGFELGMGLAGGAIGRVLAFLPVLGELMVAAFPIIIIGAAIDRLEAFNDRVEQAARNAQDAAGASAEWSDKIELENLKLEDQIAKLEHRPEHNMLKEAIIEAEMEADNLSKSIDEATSKIVEQMSKVSGWGAVVAAFFNEAFNSDTAGAVGEHAAGELLKGLQQKVDETTVELHLWPDADVEGKKKIQDKLKSQEAELEAAAKQELEKYKKMRADSVQSTILVPSLTGAVPAANPNAQPTKKYDDTITSLESVIRIAHEAQDALDKTDTHIGLAAHEASDKQRQAEISTIAEQTGKVAALNTEIGDTKTKIAEAAGVKIDWSSQLTGWSQVDAAVTATKAKLESGIPVKIQNESELRKLFEELHNLQVEAAKEISPSFSKSESARVEHDKMYKELDEKRVKDKEETDKRSQTIQLEGAERTARELKNISDTVVENYIRNADLEVKASQEAAERSKSARERSSTAHPTVGIFAQVANISNTKAEMADLVNEMNVVTRAAQVMKDQIATLGAKSFLSESDLKNLDKYNQELQKLEGMLAKLQTDHDKLGEKTQTVWKQMSLAAQESFQTMATKFNESVIGAMNNTGLRFGENMKRMFVGMADTFVQAVLKMVERWIAGEILKLAATESANATATASNKAMSLSEKFDAAKTAAANTWASVSKIPVIGPVLAPAAAAGAFAAVMAFKEGGIVPADNTVSVLHEGEMVIPADIAGGIRKMSVKNPAQQKLSDSLRGVTRNDNYGAGTVESAGLSMKNMSMPREISSGMKAIINSPAEQPISSIAAKSAEGGMVVPTDNTVSILHAQEMVLPAHISNGLQAMVGQAGGGGVSDNGSAGDTYHFHFAPAVQALDGSGIDAVLRKHSKVFVSHVQKMIRNGSVKF